MQVINKDVIIKALRVEPLLPGEFFSTGYYTSEELGKRDTRNPLNISESDFTEDREDCPVCAVGATLRAVGIYNIDDVELLSFDLGEKICELDSIASLLKQGLYLNALSCYFEGGEWQTREDLVDWVNANIPDDYSEEIKND